MNPNDVAPFLLGGLCMMIPIVAILTTHQQRMAKIIHGEGGSADTNRLRAEIAELRERLNEQALALDDLRSRSSSLPAERPQERELL